MTEGGEVIVWASHGRLLRVPAPAVMGILNITPDSFVAASRQGTMEQALATAGRMLEEGATILDIGGASARPGSTAVDEAEELERVVPVVAQVRRHFPQAVISVDTWRASVAAEAVKAGASLVNDIGAGALDEAMLETVAGLGVPYILMHMQGTPRTMQEAPCYGDVLAEVTAFLSSRMQAARRAGIADVVVDPGFGFGKTVDHNFSLLRGLPALKQLGVPVLAGLSRKSMINEVLGTTPGEALNGTTVVNTMALLGGADILRVHDVRPAVEAVKLVAALGR